MNRSAVPSRRPSVRPLKVKFLDGKHAYWIDDSISATIMHPLSLKFMLFCVLIYAMLERFPWGADVLPGVILSLLWVIVGVELLVWLWLSLAVVRFLWSRGMIQSIYTPFFTQPGLIFFHATSYWFVTDYGGAIVSTEAMVTSILTASFAMALFDIAFGSVIVPLHPSFSYQFTEVTDDVKATQPISDLPVPAPIVTVVETFVDRGEKSGVDHVVQSTSQPPKDSIADGAVVEPKTGTSETVSVGRKLFPTTSLLYIRSEDHYLHFVFDDHREMVRDQLYRVVPNLDTDLGFQVSRSVWVAFQSIADVKKTGSGKMELILKTDESVVVSQYRKVAFNIAFERYQQERLNKV